MFCLHSLHGRVGVCLGLEVVVGVRRFCICVGGRSGVGGRRQHLVGVRGPQFCVFFGLMLLQVRREGWIFVFSALLRSVGLVLLQVGRLWRA